MGTRASIRFTENDETLANIYVHSDGDPAYLGTDIKEFLKECDKLRDKRFDDASYLAARFVVWYAFRHLMGMEDDSVVDFIGIGIYERDAGDAEYVYKIPCNNNKIPAVAVAEKSFSSGLGEFKPLEEW